MRLVITRAAAPLLLLISWISLAREAGADGSVLEEFHFKPYNAVPMVPVRFRDQEYLFVLDTGCGYTSVEPEMLPTLQKGRGTAVSVRYDKTIELPLYHAEGWALGAIQLPALDTVYCFKEPVTRLLPEKIYGYLGMDVLRQFIVQIDFDAGQVRFLRSVPRDAGLRVAMEPRNANACPIVKASIGGAEKDFVLDTGAVSYAAGSFPKPDFDAMLASGALRIADDAIPGTGTSNRAAVMTRPFSIGPNQHAGLVFYDVVNPQLTDGALGLSYLRRYKVTFDFRRRAVYLAPGGQYAMIAASYDPGGLRFLRKADSVRVYGIASPAVDAGIRPTDELESVNGTETRNLDDTALAMALSRTDRPLAFVFRRPSDGRRIRFLYDKQAARRRGADRLNEESAEER